MGVNLDLSVLASFMKYNDNPGTMSVFGKVLSIHWFIDFLRDGNGI